MQSIDIGQTERQTLPRVVRTPCRDVFLNGSPHNCLSLMCEPQPSDFIKTLEDKGGLQITPWDAWRPPSIWPAPNTMASLRKADSVSWLAPCIYLNR